jgi:tetratricopeptide (TPR) repeat protein
MEALIAFSWYRCDTKPNLEIANHVVTAAKDSGIEKYIASAMWCLGETFGQLGDDHLSYDHLQEAYRLFNSLPQAPGEVDLQRLGGQCGINLVNAARMTLRDRDMVISLAREVERKCAALSDDLVHGRSLLFLGAALHGARQPLEALRYLDQARTMLEGVENTYNIAYAYQFTSWVHYDEHRFPEALDTIEEAWKHAKLTDNPLIQLAISLDLARFLFSANRDTEAWEHIKITLMNASYIGHRLIVARALEHMGYGYLRRGDYQNAYGAYEVAAETYLGTVDTHVAKRCKDNMTRIEGKQENSDMVIGFYRPWLDVDDSTPFYPPVQAAASDMPIPSS